MTFNIFTLGCKVNTYESNVIIDLLINNGYKEVSNKEVSDITVINTCTVTNTADSKSLKTIKHAINEFHNIVIVIGCFAQIGVDIISKIEGVSIILGNKNKTMITKCLDNYLINKKQIILIDDVNHKPFENMLLNNFNKTRAFVKIQDGCNNFCSYCIIPYVRGTVCSRNKEDILEEIKSLVNSNHKEIVLVGIHTGHYGSELKNYNFASLLTDILKINGIKRLRISSIEMNEITDEIIDIIKNNDVLVDHMHIPLQSGSNEILKSMNRKYLKEDFILKIEKLRSIKPDISITTDVIVGFPSETEDLFNETIETIKTIKFSKIHVFPYSKRIGTKASLMDNQIDEVTKHKRTKKLIEISNKLETDYMNKFINKKIYFLPETFKEGYLIGHTGNYLLVKAKGDSYLLNKNVPVLIESVEYPYCLGRIEGDINA